MSQDPEPVRPRPADEARLGPAALDSQLGDLVAYCRALTGREDEARSTAQEVLGSAKSLMTDPAKLRAWLFALVRMEIAAPGAPQAREIFDLVHRHGIRPEDLPVVLGISPAEADEMLAAEGELRWDDRADRDDFSYLRGQPDGSAIASPEMFETHLPGLIAYCSAHTGRQDEAVSTAHEVLDSARSLLTDPDRMRAWLFAAVRREAVGEAPASPQEILDLVHRQRITARDLPKVLGIAPIEADRLLAAAEEQQAGSVFRDGMDWDDRAVAMTGSAALNDGVSWGDGADWDETFGPKSLGPQDLDDPFRRAHEPGGRHAAPSLEAGGLRRIFAHGPIRVAAATGVVVAVIGISGAYLASRNSPPPSQASQHTKHHQPALAQSPATAASPAPTPAPTHTSNQPVSIVVPAPAPAPTSPKTSPRTSPKPSPKPSSSSPKPSSPPPSSPPPSPTPTPTASSPAA